MSGKHELVKKENFKIQLETEWKKFSHGTMLNLKLLDKNNFILIISMQKSERLVHFVVIEIFCNTQTVSFPVHFQSKSGSVSSIILKFKEEYVNDLQSKLSI